MKTNSTIKSLLTLAVVASLGICTAFAGDKDKEQAQLESKAKITKAEAQKTVLTKAADGTVKDAEIENEDGKLVWSFDITRPGTKDITEVLVDAMTGKIVKVDVESPRDQAKEAAEDVAKEKASGKPTPREKASGKPTPKDKASGSPTPKEKGEDKKD